MEGGPAGQWATEKTRTAMTKQTDKYGTWTQFIQDFEKAFISTQIGIDKRHELFKLKQGSDSTTEFNAKFQTLASLAGITQTEALTELYLEALRPAIAGRILERDTIPTTLMDTAAGDIGFYNAAIRAEEALNRISRFNPNRFNPRQ